jgi:hypothetical protein
VLVVIAAALYVRIGEIGFGLLALVVGNLWIYFAGYLYFGLGAVEVFPASVWERAVLGTLAALGL